MKILRLHMENGVFVITFCTNTLEFNSRLRAERDRISCALSRVGRFNKLSQPSSELDAGQREQPSKPLRAKR